MSQTLNIEIVNPVNYSNWNEDILNLSGYTFFHSSQWSNLISKTYDYKPIYYILKHDKRMTAVFPLMEIKSFLTGKRAVSLPFSDFSNPLVEDYSQFDKLFKTITENGKSRNWKHIDLKGYRELLPKNIPSYLEYEHILELNGDEEVLFSAFNDSTKRNIRKAVKSNVKVFKSQTKESVDQFFKLNSLTRKRHGLPPQPYSFFLNLYKTLIKPGSGFIFLAEYQNKIIAGAVYLHFGKKALYKYGASDLNYQNVRANNLVMWEAVKYYNSNKYTEFSFGKTEPDNEGLRRFKNGWSPQEIGSYSYRYNLTEDKFLNFSTQTSGFHNKIFENLPLPVLNMFGSLAYKHFG